MKAAPTSNRRASPWAQWRRRRSSFPTPATALAGQPVNEASIQAAAEIAVAAAKPISDMRGTAEFRNHLVGVLTRRTLAAAIERAK